MDINRAKEIISALAEGIDPITGEVLEENNVCNKAEVVRAFYTVLQNMKDKPQKEVPENAGKPWAREDEDLLTSLYRAGASKKELCATLRRTETGIAA